jgi:hypothetical protein
LLAAHKLSVVNDAATVVIASAHQECVVGDDVRENDPKIQMTILP